VRNCIGHVVVVLLFVDDPPVLHVSSPLSQ